MRAWVASMRSFWGLEEDQMRVQLVFKGRAQRKIMMASRAEARKEEEGD